MQISAGGGSSLPPPTGPLLPPFSSYFFPLNSPLFLFSIFSFSLQVLGSDGGFLTAALMGGMGGDVWRSHRFWLVSLFTGSFLGSANSGVYGGWSSFESRDGGLPAASSILHATPLNSCRRYLLVAPPAFYLFRLLIGRWFILLG